MWFRRRRKNQAFKELTSAAKADGQSKPVIAALKRCSTQKRFQCCAAQMRGNAEPPKALKGSATQSARVTKTERGIEV